MRQPDTHAQRYGKATNTTDKLGISHAQSLNRLPARKTAR
jgi:hypothetical protein